MLTLPHARQTVVQELSWCNLLFLDRFVRDVEKVSTMRDLFIPVFHPGGVQSIYFLDRDSIVRARKNANQLLTENETSAVNQAVAFYRHSGGISTDQEPLAAQESLALAGSAF
jgi:hypothetical protein